MDFDLRDLRYFQTIAELGHLGHAADQLSRSQPALTKCVHRLEASLGAALFTRKGRGIQLTAVGEMLLARTRRLLSSANGTFRDVQKFARGEAGHVRIGAGPIAAEGLLPWICELILAKAAGITVEIEIGTSHFSREQLRRGEVDLALGLVRENDPEFTTHRLMEDVVVVAAGATHPIFRQESPVIEDLVRFEWALPLPAMASRQWLDRTFESHGLAAPHAHIEINSLRMLAEVLARTQLLCFVSRHTLAKLEGAPLKEVELETTTLRRHLGLTYANSNRPPAVEQLVQLLFREHSSQVAGPSRT